VQGACTAVQVLQQHGCRRRCVCPTLADCYPLPPALGAGCLHGNASSATTRMQASACLRAQKRSCRAASSGTHHPSSVKIQGVGLRTACLRGQKRSCRTVSSGTVLTIHPVLRCSGVGGGGAGAGAGGGPTLEYGGNRRHHQYEAQVGLSLGLRWWWLRWWWWWWWSDRTQMERQDTNLLRWWAQVVVGSGGGGGCDRTQIV
jgi:hypothetical protein